MTEVMFVVEEAPEGGFVARAIGESIFTEANNLSSLEVNIRDAVRCHFEEAETPRLTRLHFTLKQAKG
jgi:hypothetical protein